MSLKISSCANTTAPFPWMIFFMLLRFCLIEKTSL